MEQIHTLSDDFMSTLVTLLQLAIVTGTDIYDHLSTIQLVSDDTGRLFIREEYKDKIRDEIKLLEERAALMMSGAQVDADPAGE